MTKERRGGHELPQVVQEGLSPRGRLRLIKSRILGVAWRSYLTASMIFTPAASLAALGEILTQGGVSNAVTGILNPPPPRPERPDFHVYETENGTRFVGQALFESSIRESIEAYDAWQNFSQFTLQDALKRRQPEDVFQTLETININFIYEGVGILQSAKLVGLSSDQIQVDSKNQYLWLNDEGFDLGNRFDRLLAGTTIQSKIQLIDYNLQLAEAKESKKNYGLSPEEISVLSQELQEDLGYLTWLKKNLPNFELENDSVAFISKSEMVRIARLMQDLNLIKVEPPRRIKWCGAFCLENGKFSGIASPLTGRTELDPNANTKTLAHEIAHTKFNQLIPKFTLLRGRLGQAATDDRLSYITNYAMTNTMEDFAETFAYYVMHGDYFRDLLEELKVNDTKAYAALKQKYDFIKNEASEGLEFTDGGIVRNVKREQLQQEFAGISWNPRKRTLTIQPNPNSWPGKRYFAKEFPVLTEENEIKKVTVSLEIGPSRSYDRFSYKLTIYHPELITNLSLQPQEGDDRVYVVNDYRGISKQLSDLGADESINFVPPKTEEPDKKTSIEIKVQSLSPIKSGQERKLILDIPKEDWDFEPIFYIEKIEVVEGPQSIFNTQTQEWENTWRVRNVVKFPSGEVLTSYAWLPENALGEEVEPENNP